MATDTPISRQELFAELRAQWLSTEEAAKEAQDQATTEVYKDGYTVGDVFRHITDSAHNTASDIRAMISTGTFNLEGIDDRRAYGIERFAALDGKMIPIELETAHGVIWMYIQRFSDEDLAKTYGIGDGEVTLQVSK
jgi:hypothetical protein